MPDYANHKHLDLAYLLILSYVINIALCNLRCFIIYFRSLNYQ